MVKLKKMKTIKQSKTAKRRVRTKKPNKPAHEDISVQAYHLFERRNYVHGYDREDWVEAEKMLSRKTKFSKD